MILRLPQLGPMEWFIALSATSAAAAASVLWPEFTTRWVKACAWRIFANWRRPGKRTQGIRFAGEFILDEARLRHCQFLLSPEAWRRFRCFRVQEITSS